MTASVSQGHCWLPGLSLCAAVASLAAAAPCSAQIEPSAAEQPPSAPLRSPVSLPVPAGTAANLTSDPGREALKDAWWTGPMVAASAETLPPGHALIEPYVFDIRTRSSNHLGLLTYDLLGVTDRLTLGMITLAGSIMPRVKGVRSSPLAAGDTTVLAEYRLIHFGEHGAPATISLVALESLPTGHFERLETSRAAALGNGARTTQLAVYAQSYLWLPNGRLLRIRLDAGHVFASTAHPNGQSVYDTPSGFAGKAARGPSDILDGSIEYSLAKRWALAWEMVWQRSGASRVSGLVDLPAGEQPFARMLPAGAAVYLVPALEYSWNSKTGVLMALRMSPRGRNSPPSITPAVALNWVL